MGRCHSKERNKLTLAPGGILAVMTPNWDSFHRRVLGQRWDAIIPDGHLYYFRKVSLHRWLERYGLQVVRSTTRGFRPFNARPRTRRFLEGLGLGEALWVFARNPVTGKAAES